jgi:hypothetical protein
VPSPQPSLGPVKRVRVRRNSRRVAPGSTSPSRSSTRSPLTAKTAAAEDGAGAGEAAAAAAIALRGERCAAGRVRPRVRAGTGFPSGRRPAACLSTTPTLLYSTTTATLARSQLRRRGRCRLSPRNSKRAEPTDADAGGPACRARRARRAPRG